MATLRFALSNVSNQANVYAYITGQAIDRGNQLVLMQSDGRSQYYPTSPSSTGQPLAVDCAIALGGPGSTVNVDIPHIAGGRIWFSYGQRLNFLLNPGPGLVEPSVANPSDPNINIEWGFAEFTWNSQQLYANISYVDFVALPVALTLTNKSGQVKYVPGMKPSGLDAVCAGLEQQSSRDGQGWRDLIIKKGGANLRALSPNVGIGQNPNLFRTYWDGYVNAVYAKYANETLTVNTQAQWGDVKGRVSGNGLNFGSDELTFQKPNAKDIFSNSTGPFAVRSIEHGAITARLAAAFNRSTLLINNNQPEGERVVNYYKDQTTNHFARLVHESLVQGRGYAFPYDDVAGANSGADQSGFVNDGQPQVLRVAVGGGEA